MLCHTARRGFNCTLIALTLVLQTKNDKGRIFYMKRKNVADKPKVFFLNFMRMPGLNIDIKFEQRTKYFLETFRHISA